MRTKGLGSARTKCSSVRGFRPNRGLITSIQWTSYQVLHQFLHEPCCPWTIPHRGRCYCGSRGATSKVPSRYVRAAITALLLRKVGGHNPFLANIARLYSTYGPTLCSVRLETEDHSFGVLAHQGFENYHE